MNTAEDFVNWLEGFLDACKNSPSSQQIKEVRKKISLVRQSSDNVYQSLWDPSMPARSVNAFPTITLVQPKTDPINEAFERAVEESKNVSTLEELNS